MYKQKPKFFILSLFVIGSFVFVFVCKFVYFWMWKPINTFLIQRRNLFDHIMSLFTFRIMNFSLLKRIEPKQTGTEICERYLDCLQFRISAFSSIFRSTKSWLQFFDMNFEKLYFNKLVFLFSLHILVALCFLFLQMSTF